MTGTTSIVAIPVALVAGSLYLIAVEMPPVVPRALFYPRSPAIDALAREPAQARFLTMVPHRFPAGLAGRVNTALNSMVFAWAFVVQWAMGAIIDLWPLPAARYSPLGYRVGFGAALAVALCAWVWMLVQMRRLPERTDANTALRDKQRQGYSG